MKRTFLLFVACIIAITSLADDKRAVKTSTEGGRYEIVQSEIVRRLTFKLDKFTGRTYQMVKTSYDDMTWEEVRWRGQPEDTDKEEQISFQLFLGGIMARDCILINIHTGETWMLYQESEAETLYWAPMY